MILNVDIQISSPDISAVYNIPMALLVFIMHTSVVEDWCQTGERASRCCTECEWAPVHTKGKCPPCRFSIHTSNEVLEILGKGTTMKLVKKTQHPVSMSLLWVSFGLMYV